ncbi:MAG: GxxExxY protein [Prevotella sp.]|nr:GxxExxY protein [Prevotella sp.]
MIDEDYTYRLLSCAYEVHSALGLGLLESVYEKALVYELELNGFCVRHQVPVKIKYKDREFDNELKLDLMIDDQVIIELKSVKEIIPVHQMQLLTYLRLTDTHLGYIINFNVDKLKYGIQRIVNDYK